MKDQTKSEAIKIQRVRYRLSTIKRWEPFETDPIKKDRYGIYIYFAITGGNAKVYHYFADEAERDKVIQKIDELFGINY
jgi:hypothetical protein